MASATLVLFTVYFLVAFVLRTWLQVRSSGDSGFRGISGRPGSAGRWGGVLFVLALVAGVAGPLLALLGLAPIGALESSAVQTAGIAVAVGGIGTTFAAQISMGSSWRIGVDAAEMTTLVTGGAFALARNPIFTAMILTAVGLVLMTPNIVAIAGLVMLIVAIQLQVRAVEEPYLASHHDPAWHDYASRVGRFIPKVGTIATTRSSNQTNRRSARTPPRQR